MMKTILEQIEVMQAFDRGETIMAIHYGLSKIVLLQKSLDTIFYFNWREYDYDIVRKPIEGWLWEYPDGSVGGNLFDSESEAITYHTSTHKFDIGRAVFMRQVI